MSETESAGPAVNCAGIIQASETEFDRLIEIWSRRDAALADFLPDEQACLRVMMDAYTRLKALGWNDAIYCPKDGSSFDSIELGSTGIHRCHYSGKWPQGSWWVEDGGDLWPARPNLYRQSPDRPRPAPTGAGLPARGAR